MLLWTLSGVIMVIRPIDEVRGTALLRDPLPIVLPTAPVAPSLDGLKVAKVAIEPRTAGPRWIITTADGKSRQADPATGALLPVARRRRRGARSGCALHRQGQHRCDPAASIRLVRRSNCAGSMDGWMVAMSDGTHFFVDSGSGDIVARRTRFWRFYDVMWGLHIMDLQTREDTHHPWIVIFGALALVSTLMALVMLPLTGKRKKRRSAREPAGEA